MMTTWPTTPDVKPPPDANGNPWLLWRIETLDERAVLSVAEMAECTCPDLCDRDHPNE